MSTDHNIGMFIGFGFLELIHIHNYIYILMELGPLIYIYIYHPKFCPLKSGGAQAIALRAVRSLMDLLGLPMKWDEQFELNWYSCFQREKNNFNITLPLSIFGSTFGKSQVIST